MESDENECDISKEFFSLDDFFNTNIEATRYIYEVITDTSGNFKKIKKKRESIHKKQIKLVKQFIDIVKKAYNKIKAKMLALGAYKPPDSIYLGYDDKNVVMKLRECMFLDKLIYENEFKFCVLLHFHYLNLYKIATKIRLFFTTNIIPDDKIFSLHEEFFDIRKFDDSNEEEANTLKTRISMLKNKKNSILRSLQMIQDPIWRTNFNSFFLNIVDTSLHTIKPGELFYMKDRNEDLKISIALFSSGSKYKEVIDKKLYEIHKGDKKLVVERVNDMCLDFMKQELGKLTNNRENMSLVLLYRAFFNRYYELFHHEIERNEFNNQLNILFELKKSPVKMFYVPSNLVKCEPDDTPICQFFHNDSNYRTASQNLTESLFYSNPMDCLYCIYKCLDSIYDGASFNSTNEDIEQKNNRKFYSFDDIFTLFLGCYLASDIHDIFSLTSFICNYSPRNNLIPQLDYAYSNVLGLSSYCSTLNEDVLIKEGERLNK